MKKMDAKEIEIALETLNGWAYNGEVILKKYEFADFKAAFAFMTRIAFECEAQNHHPDWENVYNRVTIKLNTHDADGITIKDIKLAQCIEELS
ncbi:4a-hydroxytetrahydrobiopterin dehydratase [Flavobacterium sp. ASW18X]|uniref:4a-hydroxytetrahydrobiopterin dehydratase n=1 Tax=Flavobacterium sp. ASW18X TaxID=2572595 RepID=UPI0010AE266C|nr:4a-hydroxytetrahydrobiopterin dehydratase [Flavobacterium sp. ASW18X]TKD63555.1 4a-hydroxytetrahydrobiopterin dehydratase [Flavobacterium sp. ASW18X]